MADGGFVMHTKSCHFFVNICWSKVVLNNGKNLSDNMSQKWNFEIFFYRVAGGRDSHEYRIRNSELFYVSIQIGALRIKCPYLGQWHSGFRLIYHVRLSSQKSTKNSNLIDGLLFPHSWLWSFLFIMTWQWWQSTDPYKITRFQYGDMLSNRHLLSFSSSLN